VKDKHELFHNSLVFVVKNKFIFLTNGEEIIGQLAEIFFCLHLGDHLSLSLFEVLRRAVNPQFDSVLECLYVGTTSKTPAERLKQHKTGYNLRKVTS
jgi:hypothetical protein